MGGGDFPVGRKDKTVLMENEAHMKKWWLLLLVALLAPIATLSHAQTIWAENRLLSGDDPLGTVTVSRTKDGELCIEANLAPGEHLAQLYVKMPWGLFLAPPETRGHFTWPTISWGTQHAPEGLTFPLGIKFAAASGISQRRFDETDMISWDIATPMPLSGLSGMLPWPPSPEYDCGDWMWVGHIKGVGPDGEGSGWIGHCVPEPGSFAGVFALGLAGLAAFRRFGRKM